MANPKHSEILDRGVKFWNDWRKDNPEIRPDLFEIYFRNHLVWNGINLSQANLQYAFLRRSDLSGADFTLANLIEADLTGADLTGADLTGADLTGADLSQAIIKFAILKNTNLNHANLKNVKLNSADLRGANLIKTDLTNADLSEANLKQIRGLETNFANANLTKACIEDWNINNKTILDNVTCDCIYLKNKETLYIDTLRKIGGEIYFEKRIPSDPNTNFAPGEFAKLVEKATETVNLIFCDGIDWKAFLATFSELQEKYQDGDLSIAAIERKSSGAFVIKLNISEEANKALIELEAKQLYEEKSKEIENYYKRKLQIKDTEIKSYERENTNILELAKTLATNRNIGDKTVMGDEINVYGPSGVGVNKGEITTETLAGVLKQLPSSSDPDKPGIKELLKQLEQAIAADESLEDKQKQKSLRRVKTIADAALNPNDPTLKERAEDAIGFLKDYLPPTAAGTTILNTVLPILAKLLGF